MMPLLALFAALALVIFWRFVLLGLLVFLIACCLLGFFRMLQAIAAAVRLTRAQPEPKSIVRDSRRSGSGHSDPSSIPHQRNSTHASE